MNYYWENTYSIRGRKIIDYIKVDVNRNSGQGNIESKIKGLITWHEYDFNILAFLIKELYN